MDSPPEPCASGQGDFRPRAPGATVADDFPMATRKKKTAVELSPQPNPQAALDGQGLLRGAAPVLDRLGKDLLARADGYAGVTAALRARHAMEVEKKRTAMQYEEWRRAFVDQVAAAWFLSVVFVRTLEDRGLLRRSRIAGPGALDAQRAFFALAPHLTERDYLLTVFRELTHLPAAAELFDARHNPVWLLAPSAEATQELLELFRAPNADTPAFRFGGDSRFLGDLYQDLNADVRARYALLQTPRFVESFILDRTLTPALERFGLEDTTIIDPTCGSGHFLLGAFDRLFERRLAEQPGIDPRQAAHAALDAISGADINPYAIAVARFRLTLAFLEKAGYDKLDDAPQLPLHLAVADSLLHNFQRKLEGAAKSSGEYVQKSLGEVDTTSRADWEGELFALEDPEATRDVLGRRYAAVVGNPPYITVKDAALRDEYRAMYPTAFRSYSLAVPFTERFFQLGREGGSVGMITANSFMKREFGKKLIEEYLPSVNLEAVINTSGAYIPGHGTPTVLLFGTAEEPRRSDLLTVLASRGEPSTPKDPERGMVWSSIAAHWSEVGFENEFISVTRTPREQLAKHPWSLGGGGATELKELLEARAEKRLGEVVESIGISCVTGEDDVYLLPHDAAQRLRVGRTMPLVTGEFVRDWSLEPAGHVVFPYDDSLNVRSAGEAKDELRHLWAFRAIVNKRRRFGTPMVDRGLAWYELQELYSSKLRTPLTITFAFVATHNHFVLDRGGKVFNRSAPIIKLPESATEDDHYALLAYLNSSTACFWMKQVFYPKGGDQMGDGGRTSSTSWQDRYEFAGTGLKALPLPFGMDGLKDFGRRLSELATKRQNLLVKLAAATEAEVASIADEERLVLHELVGHQEALDWAVYRLFGLHDDPALEKAQPEMPGWRSFEQIVREVGHDRSWFSRGGYSQEDVPLSKLQRDRLDAVKRSRELAMLESLDFKRWWRVTDVAAVRAEGRTKLVATELEQAAAARRQVATQTELLRSSSLQEQGAGLVHLESVPYLSALRFTESGMEKFRAWERTWELQRREDRGEDVGDIPVPPKYASKDFRDGRYWSLRGKLDVPKERFISYPGCESDQDGEPVYGWAGWDHLQRAVALAELYNVRKLEEGWTAERLTPMLAGLLELLPWLDQWHGDPDPNLDGAIPAEQFRHFLDAECTEHGLTPADLRAWRPAARSGRTAKKKTSRKKKAMA